MVFMSFKMELRRKLVGSDLHECVGTQLWAHMARRDGVVGA